MAVNYRVFTVWVPKEDNFEDKEVHYVGIPIEYEHFRNLWTVYHKYMLRPVGGEQPLVEPYAPIDEIPEDLEAIPWTDEHRHLADQIVFRGEHVTIMSTLAKFTGFEEKRYLSEISVRNSDGDRTYLHTLCNPASDPVWMLYKTVPDLMVCEKDSTTPLLDINAPIAQISRELDAVPWTDEYSALRAQLDAIAV